MAENLKALELASRLGADVSHHVPSKQMRPMTVRLPLEDFARLEAIASQTSMARGTIATMLIAAGFEAVMAMLPQETVDRINFIQAEALEEFREINEIEQE